MALVEDALFSRLTTHVGLNALIGTRAYPTKVPQAPDLPALAYQRITTERFHAMGSDAGVIGSRFQVTGFASTYKGAVLVKEQTIDALSRWRGTVAGVVIQDTLIENDMDAYEDETGQFMAPVDVVIYHEGA